MSDDVKKAAEDWAAEFKQWLDAGNAYGNLSEAAMAGLRDQFARAILQERRSCRAQIAEREADDYWDKANLVAAIRSTRHER